jgi:hypothetical protein
VGWRIECSDLGEHVSSRAHDPQPIPPVHYGDPNWISPGVRTIPDPRFLHPDE